MLKIRVKEIRTIGRSTQGVRLINLGAGDGVSSLARIPYAEVPPAPEPAEGGAKPKKPAEGADDADLDDDEEVEVEDEEEEADEEPEGKEEE